MTCFGINYAIQTHLVPDINQAKANYQQVVREAVERFEPGEKQVAVFFDGKFRPFNN
ncbi:hypothetical protein FACS1894166_00800 [Bacilli bacterium]|nr:hypothetical protein FACS1894166_00800 [Bacilli bacterium]